MAQVLQDNLGEGVSIGLFSSLFDIYGLLHFPLVPILIFK